MSESGAVEWCARQRSYDRERRERSVPLEEVSSHPLQEIVITVAETKVKKADTVASAAHSTAVILDPLRQTFEGKDPLSQFAAEIITPLTVKSSSTIASSAKPSPSSPLDSSFAPWSARRSAILSRYTTTEKLSVVTILAPSGDRKEASAGSVSDKVKNRLEQLDDLEEGAVQETLNLSQQEYINRIEELNTSLIHAWEEDQRVKSLKIAIQCAKMLADISVIQFYPSKFVLVTDILDTFGHLVFSRIAEKAGYTGKGANGHRSVPDVVTPDQVPESAKETCKNWFFKIASIRELIPRLYVEVAILRCYSYLTTGEYNRALVRLSSMIRGIGDPLVAAYARCYLCRVGLQVAPSIRDHLMPCFNDLLETFASQAGTDSVQNTLALQRTDIPHYLVLYVPAVDWILQCIVHGADDALLDLVLAKCLKMSTGRAMLLNSVMSSFRPKFIADQAMEFAQKIRDIDDAGFPRHLLYRSFGTCIVAADPPDDQRLALLNEVWKAITKFSSATEYIECVEVWIEYVLKYFGHRELNTVLGDIIKHMMPDRAYEEHYPQLQSVLSKILLRRASNFAELFAHEKFMPFVDMFQKETVKVEVCKSIMEAYIREPREPTGDPVVTHTLMRVCRTMHDSVNAMSVDDEVRAIGALINNGFIRAVSFGHDLEQRLAFLVECRAAFCNIDPVMQYLVHAVNSVAADVHRGSENAGGHTRRTGAFARACAAYAFITIPSLNGVFHRLALYLESGQVALMNQCLSQADSFFRAAIALIPTVPRYLDMEGKIRPTEPLLIDYILNFIATLIVVPDSPEQGTLYLLRGLLNVVQDYPWDANADSKLLVYANVLVMLATIVQEKLPYTIKRIDSNDTLYGGDPQFVADVEGIAGTLLREISVRLRELGSSSGTLRRQSQLAFELFTRFIGHADLNNDRVFKMAISLWAIVVQHGQMDCKLVARIVQHVTCRAMKPGNGVFARLAKEMQCRVV